MHNLFIKNGNNYQILFNWILFFVLLNRDVDQVQDMMDDIAEQQDVAKEISDAISNPVGFGKYESHDSIVQCTLLCYLASDH